MLWLAFRMLFQERGRLVITLVGIAFSSVLTLVEVGNYLGMTVDVKIMPAEK
jgi:hypothetical protein